MKRTLALILILLAAASPVMAQGKSGRSGKANAPGQAKKVTPAGAIGATRDILVKHGFVFVRAEQMGATQVIYYRRGNMGKGKGLGPIVTMVIKPSNDIVVFENAPSPAFLIDIKLRLGL